MAHLLGKGVLLLALLAMAAVPIAVRAETTEAARAEAKKHYDRAMELNEDGQVAAAIIELKRCYEIAPHHTVLYGLGQAYITLGRPVEAVDALQRYLEEGGKTIKPARRVEVEREIARQQTRIATIEVRGLPEGAVVAIDSDDVGRAPLASPVRVSVGRHVVTASARGYEVGEAKIETAGEDRKVVELKLESRAGHPMPGAGPAFGVDTSKPRLGPATAVSIPQATTPSSAVISALSKSATRPIRMSEPEAVVSQRDDTQPGKTSEPEPRASSSSVVPDNGKAATVPDAKDESGVAMSGLEIAGCVTGLAGIAVMVYGASQSSVAKIYTGGAGLVLGTLLVIIGDKHALEPSGKQVRIEPALGPSFAGVTAAAVW